MYVDQPPGFVVPNEEEKIYKLKKEWDWFIFQSMWVQEESEWSYTLLKFWNCPGILMVSLYVDDVVFTWSNDEMITKFKEDMMRKYEVTCFGLFVSFPYNWSDSEFKWNIYPPAEVYRTLPDKFELKGYKYVATPLIANEKLSENDSSGLADETLYIIIDGSLNWNDINTFLLHWSQTKCCVNVTVQALQMRLFTAKYLAVYSTWQQLGHTSCLLLVCYQGLTKLHMGTTKKVLRYVYGTIDFGIGYEKGEAIVLVGLCDND